MKKIIGLFAIVSLLVLSMSSCKRSSSDIICDGDFCYWQRDNSNNYYRFDKNGKVRGYNEYTTTHKIFMQGVNPMYNEPWSLHDDTLLASYFFKGRIVFIRDTLIILEGYNPPIILHKVDRKNSTFRKLKAAPIDPHDYFLM